MPEITTKEEAVARGERHFYTGAPCSRGHIDYRYVSTGGCKTCHREWYMERYSHKTAKRRRYSCQASFVRAAKLAHPNKAYNYALVSYQGSKTKVQIGCPDHGPFWQTPDHHVLGNGCPHCRYADLQKAFLKPQAVFAQQAAAVWGDAFDYAAASYIGANRKLTLRCIKHDVTVEQTARDHLAGLNPCPRCNHMKSAPEDAVASFLSIFTTVERRNRILIAPKELDIYLPEHRLAVEFCGMYWHSHGSRDDERKNKLRHAEKHRRCAEKGIRLLTIYETEWTERQPAIKRLLRNALGRSRGRLMARKCRVDKPTTAEARAFYEAYHPQGGSGAGEHYGLYHGAKLVACMRFTFGNNDRGAGAETRQWTLSRYATRVPVAGAASRLFSAFVAERRPSEVKSFSDNRLFDGGMYGKLGFVFEEHVAPDYQVWSPKLGLRPKPHYQRRALQTRLRDHGIADTFCPESDPRTEAEMTYLMGARRIYDCGKRRWRWTAT
jgi:G:T-mismatch repair DNA endonuclease (very short patch repair protein)